MNWRSVHGVVAEPAGAPIKVAPMAGAARIRIDAPLHLIEWPWATDVAASLVPQHSDLNGCGRRSTVFEAVHDG